MKPQPKPLSPPIIRFVFRWDEILNLNFSRFLSLYEPDKRSPEALRVLKGRLHVVVSRPGGSPEHLCELPETRRFFRELHRVWPHWLFFSLLSSQMASPPDLVLCALEDVCVVSSDKAPRILISASPSEFIHLLVGDGMYLLNTCAKAGVSADWARERLRLAFGLAGLPFPDDDSPYFSPLFSPLMPPPTSAP